MYTISPPSIAALVRGAVWRAIRWSVFVLVVMVIPAFVFSLFEGRNALDTKALIGVFWAVWLGSGTIEAWLGRHFRKAPFLSRTTATTALFSIAWAIAATLVFASLAAWKSLLAPLAISGLIGLVVAIAPLWFGRGIQ